MSRDPLAYQERAADALDRRRSRQAPRGEAIATSPGLAAAPLAGASTRPRPRTWRVDFARAGGVVQIGEGG